MVNELMAPAFVRFPGWSRVPEYALSHHLWAEEYPAFMQSSVQACAVKGEGLYFRLTSSEAEPKAEFFNRDDPVYRDSCLEVFLQLFSDDFRYINIEMNPNCACLAQLGESRYDRIPVSSLTQQQCAVTPADVENGWGVELFVPEGLLAACFSRDYAAGSEIRLNCYKCGDDTAAPHYSSLFFVNTPAPDFHRPECFGTLKFITEKD